MTSTGSTTICLTVSQTSLKRVHTDHIARVLFLKLRLYPGTSETIRIEHAQVSNTNSYFSSNLNLAFNTYFHSRHAISKDGDGDETFGARSVESPALENKSSKFSSDDEMHELSDDSEEDRDQYAAGHNSA